MSVPISNISVHLSFEEDTYFTKDGRTFKVGNTDWTLNLIACKIKQFDITENFRLIFFDHGTKEFYEVPTEMYILNSDGTLTIEGAAEFVHKAGRFSFILQQDCDTSYQATYTVTGDFSGCDSNLLPFNPLPFIYIKNIVEEEGTWYAYDQDNNLVTSWSGGVSAVTSVNGKTGDVELMASDIKFIDYEETVVNVSETLNFLLNTSVTQEQLQLANMTDNDIPNDNSKPYRPYLDTDKRMKYSPLVEIGEPNTQEAIVIGGGLQLVQAESEWTEIVFDTNKVVGEDFSADGNGIVINSIANQFDISATLNYSFNNVWLVYPITLEVRLIKNGVDTGLILAKEVTNQSGGTIKIAAYDSSNIPSLTVGDKLTIEVRAYDSSGLYGDGSWASFTLGTGRNFSCYYRSLISGGYADPVENIWAKRFIINKTGTVPVPSGDINANAMGLITWDDQTIYTNNEDITFNALTNAVHFTTEQIYGFLLNVSLPIGRSSAGGGSGTGAIVFLANVEYNDPVDGWTQYNPFNNSRTLDVGNGDRRTIDFHAYLRLEFAGEYRIRFYWLDVDAGALEHQPLGQSVNLGGLLGGQALLDQLGRFELVGMPIS